MCRPCYDDRGGKTGTLPVIRQTESGGKGLASRMPTHRPGWSTRTITPASHELHMSAVALAVERRAGTCHSGYGRIPVFQVTNRTSLDIAGYRPKDETDRAAHPWSDPRIHASALPAGLSRGFRVIVQMVQHCLDQYETAGPSRRPRVIEGRGHGRLPAWRQRHPDLPCTGNETHPERIHEKESSL